jgi:hypothetical protein
LGGPASFPILIEEFLVLPTAPVMSAPHAPA